MKILNLGNLTLNLTTSTDNIIPTIPSGQMLSFDDTGWNNDTFTIPQNINSTVALENNSNMQIYVVDSGTDTTTMTGDIILGTNNITGTTGLIQGFNIPALDTRITTEASTRLTNDNTLQTNITAEAKSRLDADTAEASTRLTNDNTLQTNITAEAKSRLDADTAEASTRLTNDNTLQTNITAEQTSRLAEVDVERQKINTILSGASVNLDTLLEIVTAYQLADTSVLASITGLQNADTAEASTRLTNDNTLQTNITAEAKSRLDADSLKLNLTGGTVTGTLISSISTLTPIIDINTTGTLSIGNTTATGITLGKTGIITTIPGNLNINGTVNLTGQVTTNQTPSAATQLVPKSYVDTALGALPPVVAVTSSYGPQGFRDTWAQSTGGTIGLSQSFLTMPNNNLTLISTSAGAKYSYDGGRSWTNCVGVIAYGVLSYSTALGLAVLVSSTQCQTSVDGITWTTAVARSGDAGWGDIKYAYGLFIMTNGNILLTSPDGVAWTVRSSTRNVYVVVFTGTKLITFGSAGCMTSTDGITWTHDALATSIRAAVYCANISTVIAIPHGTRDLIKSVDNGVSWTTLTNYFPITISPNIMIWSDDLSMAYTCFGQGAGASDSVYWYEIEPQTGTTATGGLLTQQGVVPGTSVYSMVYTHAYGRFLISRSGGTLNPFFSTRRNSFDPTSIVSSVKLTNGSVNSTILTSGAASLGVVMKLPTTIGTAGQFLTTDGAGISSWGNDALKLNLAGGALTGQVTTNQTPSAATQLVPKSYVDAGDALQLNLVAGLANNVNSLYSSAGVVGYRDSWVRATGGTTGLCQGLATNGTTVVNGTSSGIKYSSDNGVTYADVAASITNTGVIWVSELTLYIAKNATQCQTSTDGITWTAAVAVSGKSFGINTSVGNYVYAFGLIVAVNNTAGSYIQTSPDGLTWTVRTATRTPFSMVFTGTKIITFGQSGCMTSTDGITWVNDAQTVVTRVGCFSSSTSTIYTIPQGTTSLMKSTDDGVSWVTLTSIFPISMGLQFILWNDTARVGYVFQESGAAANPLYMYQFNGTDRAVGGHLFKQGVTTLNGAGPYSGLYIPSIERFIIARNANEHPYYSTQSNSIVSTGNITSYGTLSGGGIKVMAYGFNQTTTANAYGVPSGIYGATSGGVSGQSTRFYAPVTGIITAYSKVFLTANTTAILNIYVSGVLKYSSVAGDLLTITGSVSGLNVAVAAGAYIEVLISGATTAGLGNGLIVIVY
jgi:hypothetical protein